MYDSPPNVGGNSAVKANRIGEAQMKKNANANRSGRSPGTHPDHPVPDTGNLVARIQARRIS